jgi:hypothetical protein
MTKLNSREENHGLCPALPNDDKYAFDWASADEESVVTRIRQFGMATNHFAGIQFDVNVVAQRIGAGLREAHLCDHNCTLLVNGNPTGGQYDCPAATSLNSGLIAGSLARGPLILQGIAHILEGLSYARKDFFENDFDLYVSNFNVIPAVAQGLRQLVNSASVEVALFGGSPEIHPDILMLIRELKDAGYPVHVTMTGRKMLKEPKFVEELLLYPPDLVGVSADDFDGPDQVAFLGSLNEAELVQAWRAIPHTHGQRQKAYEAMYLVKLAARYGTRRFPRLLFNIAIHPGNLPYMDSLLKNLTRYAPGVMLNPFPVQTGFWHAPGRFSEQEVWRLEEFVDRTLSAHHDLVEGRAVSWAMVPRLHYWLLLKSVFETFRDDPRRIANTIGGDGLWTCYGAAGSGRYIQVSSSSRIRHQHSCAGGHLACFWNDTVTDEEGPLWERPNNATYEYVTRTRSLIAGTKDAPCPGCGFPRLVSDCISAETGMNVELRRVYLRLRRAHLGY